MIGVVVVGCVGGEYAVDGCGAPGSVVERCEGVVDVAVGGADGERGGGGGCLVCLVLGVCSGGVVELDGGGGLEYGSEFGAWGDDERGGVRVACELFADGECEASSGVFVEGCGELVEDEERADGVVVVVCVVGSGVVALEVLECEGESESGSLSGGEFGGCGGECSEFAESDGGELPHGVCGGVSEEVDGGFVWESGGYGGDVICGVSGSGGVAVRGVGWVWRGGSPGVGVCGGDAGVDDDAEVLLSGGACGVVEECGLAGAGGSEEEGDASGVEVERVGVVVEWVVVWFEGGAEECGGFAGASCGWSGGGGVDGVWCAVDGEEEWF